MVVAILFLVIAILAIVLNIIMGHFLRKKMKTLESLKAAASGADAKEFFKQGKVSNSKQVKLNVHIFLTNILYA